MKPSLGTTDLCRWLGTILAVLAAAESLPAQTVQLPAVRNFSASGGVLVPDRGTAFLGGNSSIAAGSSSRGLPFVPHLPSRSFGSQITAGGVSVTATIIDLDAIDRQILGYDPRDRARRGSESRAVKSGVDEIAEAKSLVRNARRAWQAGQTSTAQAVYELAIQRLRQLAKDELHRGGTSGDASAEMHPSWGTGQRRGGQAADLLALARAEYARFFPIAADSPLVQP